MNFVNFLIRRLLGIVVVMFGVTLITFVISHLVPADPAAAALGDRAREDQVAAFKAANGLDKPIPEQYFFYMNNLLHGDLGTSIRTRRPVAQDLSEFFPATVELSLAALIISLATGLPAGVWSAVFRNRAPDFIVCVFALIGGSLPIFWLGLLLIG